MKILIITPTLDLSKPFSATPFLIQLYKGFYEEGHELLIIPYSGRAIPSLWWKSFPNPNYYKALFLEKILNKNKYSYNKRKVPFTPTLVRIFAKPNLENLIKKILIQENNVDAVIFISIPLNQIRGIPTNIKKIKKIPVLFYDLDIPTSLHSYPGSSFDYYPGASLHEFDSFITLSEGATPELLELGANHVDVVHVGMDPEICSPINIQKDIDFFFLGTSGRERENNIKMMISEPSKVLKNCTFVISGRKIDLDIGKASLIPMLPFSEWRRYCNRAIINLNPVRESHASYASTSTARPFELASMGCCIVSAPYDGLEKWFDTKNEILIAHSPKECIEIYRMLLNDPELRSKMGIAARKRVIKEHTSRHRVREIIDILKKMQK